MHHIELTWHWSSDKFRYYIIRYHLWSAGTSTTPSCLHLSRGSSKYMMVRWRNGEVRWLFEGVGLGGLGMTTTRLGRACTAQSFIFTSCSLLEAYIGRLYLQFSQKSRIIGSSYDTSASWASKYDTNHIYRTSIFLSINPSLAELTTPTGLLKTFFFGFWAQIFLEA